MLTSISVSHPTIPILLGLFAPTNGQCLVANWMSMKSIHYDLLKMIYKKIYGMLYRTNVCT